VRLKYIDTFYQSEKSKVQKYSLSFS